ncbi:MAG: hypothetical protein WCY11_12250 [Novosphingobium sp.]
MIGANTPKRPRLLSRTALGMALALGTVAGSALVATPAMAAKKQSYNFTKPFQAAAGPANKAIDDAAKRADVVAASAKVTQAEQAANAARGDARKQAEAAADAAIAELGNLLSNEKALVATAFGAIGNEDDRFMAGNLKLTLGNVARDVAMQREGLQAMLQSGKANPADVPKFNFFVGRFSMIMNDYPAAVSALQAAIDGGYHENNADILLVEAQSNAGQVPQALATLRKSVDAARAAGRPIPEQWYTRGYQIAYRAKMGDATNEWAAEAARANPSPFNWLGALQLVREFGNFTSHEEVDVGRLMKRTGALGYDARAASREYIEFVQAAVKWRLWPEANAAIAEGISVGALNASDPFVTDAKAQVRAGAAAEAADLAGAMRDAPKAANGLTAFGAGDMLLSKGDAAQAETFYQMALSKGGIDRDRALTRLAIAQYDQGKYADAKATFAQVGGNRAALARLGAILAEQKMAPAAAAPAPAAN